MGVFFAKCKDSLEGKSRKKVKKWHVESLLLVNTTLNLKEYGAKSTK